MTTRRIVTGTMIAGFALAGLAAPIASAAPDCSPAAVDSQVSSITQQAQAYMDSHPAGNKMLMTAALQLIPQLSIAIVVGKLAADIFFYGLAIMAYELRQKLMAS